MVGKVVVVTGATSGIGEATAYALARKGASLVIVGRDRQRSQAVAESIRRATGHPEVEFLVADLSSQAEVRRLAQEFRQRHSRLDVLINNAGAFFLRRQLSADGIEMTLALNHLASFLLTHLLLDLMKASAPARIVNVSSMAHLNARIDLSNLDFSGWQGYGKSKLANLLFTYELARRLEGSGVTANALHPGLVASNIGMNNTGMVRWVKPLVNLFSISCEEGARTSVCLASSPEVEGVSGRYFVSCKEETSSPVSRDRELAQRLWQISSELTGCVAPTGSSY